MPNTYAEVRNALRKAQTSSTEPVAEVFVRDPPMAARIMQVANSAFFGQRRAVDTVSRAIFVLGLELVQNLVLAAGAFQNMCFPNIPHLNLEDLWQHSLATGIIARHIALAQRRPEDYQETAMLAGTMHDLGKLILAKYAAQPYGEILTATAAGGASLPDIEREELGVTHSSVGGYPAQWWHLPAKIVDAVRYHHEPAKAQTDEQLTHLIHLANALAHRLELGASGPVRECDFAPSTAAIAGLRPDALDKLETSLRNTELITAYAKGKTMAKEHTLLVVDDEENILHSLRRLLHREDYEILLAHSGWARKYPSVSRYTPICRPLDEPHSAHSHAARLPRHRPSLRLLCVEDPPHRQYPAPLRGI